MPKINGLDWINIHNTNWRAAQAASERREYTLLVDRLLRANANRTVTLGDKSIYPNTEILVRYAITRTHSGMLDKMLRLDQHSTLVECVAYSIVYHCDVPPATCGKVDAVY
jgi:hypothetical protein